MKVFLRIFLFSILVFVATIGTTLAQNKEPFHNDWLEKDVRNLKLLLKTFPVESQSLQSIDEILYGKPLEGNQDFRYSDLSEDHGFGFKEFRYDVAGGYCHVFIRGFAFYGRFARLKAGIDCSSDNWRRIRPTIVNHWKAGQGPEFEEVKGSIFVTREYNDVIKEYKTAVAKELGEMEIVTVPPALKNDYEYLISQFVNSVVGVDGCDIVGEIPQGKESIDSLVKAKRVDLVENVLRGYNPGGRIYAVMALKKFKESGMELNAKTAKLIEKVLNLPLKIEICEGCLHSYHSPTEILTRFRY